jgi:hypothetical protein
VGREGRAPQRDVQQHIGVEQRVHRRPAT